MELEEYFNINRHIALGFSGGVDSAYLLYMAVKFGTDVHPYFLKTPFQTDDELIDAKEFSHSLGTELTVLELDILQYDDVRKNDQNRCYFCKHRLFSAIIDRASAEGYDVVIEGTNASDDISDRPGYRTLQELNVQSPLLMCGVTKDTIRKELYNAGISIWNKASSACLATRIATGTELSYSDLMRISTAEREMAAMGFLDFRVRIFNNAAKIELKSSQMALAVEHRTEILEKLSPHFGEIMLNLKER